MPAARRLLITGANGFIGSTLGLMLNNSKNWKIYPLTRTTCDLLSFQKTKKIIQAIQPHGVVHLAAHTPQKINDPWLAASRNIQMTHHLAAALKEYPPQRIIHIGTIQEYGSSTCHEDRTPCPRNPYALSKYVGLELLKASGLPFVHLRFPIVYGPNQKGGYFLSSLIASTLKNQAMSAASGGKQKRDFLYVDDAAKAIILALETTKVSGQEIINVAYGHSYALRQVAQLIGQITRKKIKIHWKARPYPCNQPKTVAIPTLKAKKLLNFSAQHSLEEGLRQTLLRWRDL
ncbi:MAG: NAD(P)-dependent oxidoreductase [Elusimicrobia bacterium]|nr:NAD(P)-dependent oxidoreductase [Elusimicrobiota bacterium]